MRVALLSSHLEGLTEQTEIGYENRQISRAVKACGGELILVDPNKLSYGVEGNIAFARFEGLDSCIHSVEDIDALLVRRTRGFIEEIMDFAEFAEQANRALVISDPISSFGRPTSKVESIVRRSAKFPQPDTQVVSKLGTLHPETRFPVIAKPTHGASGRGVVKCENKSALAEYLSSVSKEGAFAGYGTLVQQALDIDREFRVMVVGGKALGCVEKMPIEGKPDVRNAYQGGVFRDYTGANRADVIHFAENLSRFLEQDISGVDIIQSGGRLYVIECNRNPQFQEFDFATKSRTGEAIVKMLCDRIAALQGVKIDAPEPVDHQTNIFPTLFIGCSSEGLGIAEEIQYGLSRCSDPVLWNQGTFESGVNVLSSLNEALHNFDYAIFCITPDDLTNIRGNSVFEPRDNVIFEAGLFMGRLGFDRVLLVVNQNEFPSLPSDLMGTNIITWRKFQGGDLRPALAPAILDIKRRLRLQ